MDQLGFHERVRQELRFCNYSPETIKSYLSALRSFVAHFWPRHPRELTGSVIRDYLVHLLEHGTDLRYIQKPLGHRSSRMTEINDVPEQEIDNHAPLRRCGSYLPLFCAK